MENDPALGFSALTLEDRPRLAAVLAKYPQPLSDYCPASLLCWAPILGYRAAIHGEETLLVSCALGPDARRHLCQPVGAFSRELQAAVLRRARALAHPIKMVSVSGAFLAGFPAFAAAFEVAPDRDRANYVYSAGELAGLPGRSHAKKRNLIAQAARLYRWTAEPLAPVHARECLAVVDDIAAGRDAGELSITLEQETRALARALRLLGPLELQGLILRVEGRLVAFSIYERLGPETAVVLFERALRSYKGLYQVVNQETARVLAARGFTEINREEDLGDPGLRQAKESYHPARLEMSYTLTLRG